MSVPLDRLYNFLHDLCNHDVIIYHFYPHGSKKPENIQPLFSEQNVSKEYFLNVPVLFHDQEPLQFSEWSTVPAAFKIPGRPHSKLKVRVTRFSTYDKLILVHSELNSPEVDKFEQDGAIPVYYWSHAIIANDWFRYAAHDQKLKEKQVTKKFLIYNRAWKGTREYRLKFADLLISNNLQNECITSFNPVDSDEHYTQHSFANKSFEPTRQDLETLLIPNTSPSSASAEYDLVDYQRTDIEVVLETLFDDTRWHLTEKALRPIAVGQPFILCATPGSLKYLRRYGFETFSQYWDESYDDIQDPVERLNEIVKLMKSLSNVDATKAREIAKRNQKRFFSKEFMDQVLSEFQTNMSNAVLEASQSQTCSYLVRHCNMSPGYAKTVPQVVFDHVRSITPSQDSGNSVD